MFSNCRDVAPGVRPSSGAATAATQSGWNLRRLFFPRALLWPGTATLSSLKTLLAQNDLCPFERSTACGVDVVNLFQHAGSVSGDFFLCGDALQLSCEFL